MSEQSVLSEPISSGLLNEAKWTVFFTDGNGVASSREVFLPVTIQNPYQIDLSQFIPNQPVDLPGFVNLVSQLIEDEQDRMEVTDGNRVKLLQEYQPEHAPELGSEWVTYKLIRREPAKMSVDGRSRPNRSFGHNYDYRNAKEPNKILSIESRPIDHVIEFAVWGKTATLANARALWLERLLVSHRWLFSANGVNPFFWKERGPDTLWTPSGARLHQRPMQFTARLREYMVLAFPTIKEFEMDVNTQV